MVGNSYLLEFSWRSTYSWGSLSNCTWAQGRLKAPRRHLEPVRSVVKISGCKMESFDCNFQNQIHFRVFVKFNNPSAVYRNKKWISFSLVVINKWLHCEKIKQKQTRY